MGKLLGFITGPFTGLVGEVGKLIDGVSTTTEEKLSAQAKLKEIENAFILQMTVLDTQFAQEQAKVIMAEVNSESWMTRNWRPSLMYVFIYIIFHTFVLVPVFSIKGVAIPPEMWELLKLGMGGYIFGRSGEYVAQQAKEAFVATKKK